MKCQLFLATKNMSAHHEINILEACDIVLVTSSGQSLKDCCSMEIHTPVCLWKKKFVWYNLLVLPAIICRLEAQITETNKINADDL